MHGQLELATSPASALVAKGNVGPSGQRLVTPDAWDPDSSDGLLLSVDTEPESRFAKATLIAIDFPAFSDGRGLSLAVLLRKRYGFTGELRAVGDIRADILHYLYRCGFDSYLMSGEGSSVTSDGTMESTSFNALTPYSDHYQASVLEPRPAYLRVRRGA